VRRAASAAEDACRDPEAGGGGGEAGVVLAVGDLPGDLAELRGHGALGGMDALEAVEDLVVLGAAGGEHGDDMLDAAAADVGDVGLDVRSGGAGPGGAADALLQAARQPWQVEVAEDRRALEVVG
jgi:hypothetical protein